MLTVEQAFKYGFLHKCAELGLSDEATARVIDRAQAHLEAHGKEAFERLPEKQAFTLSGAASSVLGGLQSLGSWALPVGGALAIGAPVAGGYLAGSALGQLNDADDTDIDELKKRELIEAYQRASAQANPKPAAPQPKRGRR